MENKLGGHMTNIALIIASKCVLKIRNSYKCSHALCEFTDYLLISIICWVDTERHYLSVGRRDENVSISINALSMRIVYNSTMEG